MYFSSVNSPSLVYLTKLDENFLSGKVHEDIGNLTMLQQLSLRSNQFSDVIPSSVSYLKELLLLDLSNNTFSMEIYPTSPPSPL